MVAATDGVATIYKDFVSLSTRYLRPATQSSFHLFSLHYHHHELLQGLRQRCEQLPSLNGLKLIQCNRTKGVRHEGTAEGECV